MQSYVVARNLNVLMLAPTTGKSARRKGVSLLVIFENSRHTTHLNIFLITIEISCDAI
jgi:hypothetical protein